MKNNKFIKKFSKITVRNICKRLKIDTGNISKGSTSQENIDKVRDEIIKELGMLFIDENTKNVIIKYINEIRAENLNFLTDENRIDLETTYSNISKILNEMENFVYGYNTRAL